MSWGRTGAEAVGHGAERGTETFPPIRSFRSMFDLAHHLTPEEEEEEQGTTRKMKSFKRIKSFRRRSLILPRKPDQKEIMDKHDAAMPPVLTGAKQGVCRLKQSRSARDSSKELALAHASSKKSPKDAGRPDPHEFLGLEPPSKHQNTTTTPHKAMLFRIRRGHMPRFGSDVATATVNSPACG